MAKKMDPIVRLAREICWAGFHDPKNVRCTKKQYWERIAPDARLDYILEAKRIAWLLSRIDLEPLNLLNSSKRE